MNKIDLHMHSRASDGWYDSKSLVERCREIGLRIISITDHDTIEGVEDAILKGKDSGVKVLSGVEISVTWKGKSIEILGYAINCENPSLLALFKEKKENRIERARSIVDKLNSLGMPVVWNRLLEIGGEGVLGRPHIAQAMVEAGYVESTYEAFERYLGTSKPAYVPGKKELPFDEAISIIHEAEGVASIAHPYLEEVPNYINLPAFLADAIPAGIDGIECFYTGYSLDISNELKNFAVENRLICTGGSDFHGGNINPHLKLGEVEVPAYCVDMIEQKCYNYKK